VAPSGPEASPARAELARSPRLTLPSAHMRERTEVSFSCGENGRRARKFPLRRWPLRACGKSTIARQDLR
jgi:hypothetical protein